MWFVSWILDFRITSFWEIDFLSEEIWFIIKNYSIIIILYSKLDLLQEKSNQKPS